MPTQVRLKDLSCVGGPSADDLLVAVMASVEDTAKPQAESEMLGTLLEQLVQRAAPQAKPVSLVFFCTSTSNSDQRRYKITMQVRRFRKGFRSQDGYIVLIGSVSGRPTTLTYNHRTQRGSFSKA